MGGQDARVTGEAIRLCEERYGNENRYLETILQGWRWQQSVWERDTMDTKEQAYFEAVYQERSINQAAKKLFISPQGLGRIIRNLEAEFGAEFFERTKKGMVPTESAHLLHTRGKEIADKMNRLKEEMKQFQKRDEILRIGCANGVLKAISLNLILDFIRKYPGIHVEWSEYENSQVLSKLMVSELEYGFVVGEAEDSSICQRLVYSGRQVLFVYRGHPYYERDDITLDMLREETLLIMNEQFHMYHDFMRACQLRGFTPKIGAKVMDGGTLLRLCTQKIGLAVTPEFGGEIYLRDQIRPIPFEGNPNWNIYGTYWKERENYEVIRKFDQHLRSQK